MAAPKLGTVCPAPELLEAFRLGKLSEEETSAIAAHLETCANCQDRLDQLPDPDDALLAGLKKIGQLAPRPTSAAAAPQALPEVPGYRLLGEIGKGGMGVVYRAWDLRLHRIVAIKTLQAPHHQRAAVERFCAEAQITGQLAHPGIPAVHELGTLPDGRPFLAMRLVKGKTLSELLAERPDPTHDRGRFLAIFEQVCHAVGYAHDHRVIHRDLKPSNVMVGAHGEVQVMDWGLAKVLVAHGDDEDTQPDPQTTVPMQTEIETPARDSSATRTGVVIGTPAYMPPEQAAGEIRKLDPRSDVFGLGAILCQILTGSPPIGEPVPTPCVSRRCEASWPTPGPHWRPVGPSQT